MKYGVVYKFKPHKKINGTLFYCYEHAAFLRQFVDAKLYIVNVSQRDLALITQVFTEKYNVPTDNIVPVTPTELYTLKLDHTIVLDVMTFSDCKEFFTNTVHCYSNDTHGMFRYKNDRDVIYYGSYPYQKYDVFSYLKLNFGIFKPLESTRKGVFVSTISPVYHAAPLTKYEQLYDRPVIIKHPSSAIGNIFEHIDIFHYVHNTLDKNNRMIPEALYYGKQVVIEEGAPFLAPDSVQWRYDDIVANGLGNYTLTEQDAIIQACLK